jgi:hypothetical protein
VISVATQDDYAEGLMNLKIAEDKEPQLPMQRYDSKLFDQDKRLLINCR